MLASTSISKRHAVAGQSPIQSSSNCSHYQLPSVSHPTSPLPRNELKRTTNAASCVVVSRECSRPPTDGRTSGKRVVPATVRSSSNVPRENVYPACSPRRTLLRQPLVHYPRRHRLPPSFLPPLPQLLPQAPLLHPRGALKYLVYPSRSPRRTKKERNLLSGCTQVCSTSWTRSSSLGLSWSATAVCARRARSFVLCHSYQWYSFLPLTTNRQVNLIYPSPCSIYLHPHPTLLSIYLNFRFFCCSAVTMLLLIFQIFIRYASPLAFLSF